MTSALQVDYDHENWKPFIAYYDLIVSLTASSCDLNILNYVTVLVVRPVVIHLKQRAFMN